MVVLSGVAVSFERSIPVYEAMHFNFGGCGGTTASMEHRWLELKAIEAIDSQQRKRQVWRRTGGRDETHLQHTQDTWLITKLREVTPVMLHGVVTTEQKVSRGVPRDSTSTEDARHGRQPGFR
jgi:hypothetical protein